MMINNIDNNKTGAHTVKLKYGNLIWYVGIFAIILLFTTLFLYGCTSAGSDKPDEAEQEPPTQVAAVYEYGTPTEIIDNEDVFHCYFLYPQAGDESLDEEFRTWSYGIYDTARGEIDELVKEDPDVSGELNMQYNSYLATGNFAGIEETGSYINSHMANEASFVKTFNVNVKEKRLLTNDEIIDPAQEKKVIDILKEKILADDPNLKDDTANMDGSWLDHIVLKHEGIGVLLEKGKHLPSYVGLKQYDISYKELGNAFLLFDETGATPPVKQPATKPSAPAPGADIDPNKPMVALTFDDGPSKFTPNILDLLKQYGGRATFCVVGNRTKNFATTIQRTVAEGSEVIGHSWDHKQLTRLTPAEIRSELADTNDAIEKISGVKPTMYRPPYGSADDTVKGISKELGLSLINWSIDTLDWKTRNADATYKSIMENVKNGSIILCHDIHGATAEAMKRVIPDLISKGYQLVTVSELMSFSDKPLTPGTVYYQR